MSEPTATDRASKAIAYAVLATIGIPVLIVAAGAIVWTARWVIGWAW